MPENAKKSVDKEPPVWYSNKALDSGTSFRDNKK